MVRGGTRSGADRADDDAGEDVEIALGEGADGATAMAPGLPKRVLVIEDDKPIREGLSDFLSMAGYTVLEASDGVEAFDLISHVGPPDIILVDLMMPRMDGWEFIEEVREDKELADLPVVVVTAARNANVSDVDAFISKPFAATELLEIIRDECGG